MNAIPKLLFVMLIGLAGCSTIQVSYDYDKDIDFSKYETYAFSEESLELPVDDLNRDRLITAIENEMSLKGYTMQKNPDVVIDLHIKTQQQLSAYATTTGYGGRWRYGYGGGFATTQDSYDEYTEGTLFIFIVDMATEKIVWQGTGTKTLEENMKPEKREETINYSISQIMANYPPKQ